MEGTVMEIASEEVQPNLAQGFVRAWWVNEDYQIIGDVLQPQSPEGRVYAPMVHREIPGELAKLRQDDEAGLLKFARTYGLLGYSHLVPPERRVGGDPVSWIWAHVETVRTCLQLTLLLQEDAVEALEHELRARRGPGFFPPQEENWPVALVAERETISLRQWMRTPWTGVNEPRDARIETLARQVRRGLINPNIKGMSRALEEVREKDRSFWQFHALIEVAYWQLADIVDRGRVKRCEAEGCGAVFIQTDGRERFCPPRFRQTESPCAVRERVRRHRNKNPNGPKRRVPSERRAVQKGAQSTRN
jgi:predicted RNA-binding Zn ribbon-like protein